MNSFIDSKLIGEAWPSGPFFPPKGMYSIVIPRYLKTPNLAAGEDRPPGADRPDFKRLLSAAGKG